MKKLFYLLLVLGIAVAGGYLGMRYYLSQKVETVEAVDGTVLLEKVQQVAKMITVEGYFSELYDHKDYYSYDISIFRKKAILKVKGKVSIGYDLKKMEFDINPIKRELVIRYFPDPEVLSIDTDVSYFDLQEGMFNTFNEDDLTKLNFKAKDLIRQKANSSDLMLQAEDQANDIRDLIIFIAEESGWTVSEWTRIEHKEFLSKPDSLSIDWTLGKKEMKAGN